MTKLLPHHHHHQLTDNIQWINGLSRMLVYINVDLPSQKFIPLTHSHQVEGTHYTHYMIDKSTKCTFWAVVGCVLYYCAQWRAKSMSLKLWWTLVVSSAQAVWVHRATICEVRFFRGRCNEYNFHFTLYLSTYRTTKGFFRNVKLRPITSIFSPIDRFSYSRTYARPWDTENDPPTNWVCVYILLRNSSRGRFMT